MLHPVRVEGRTPQDVREQVERDVEIFRRQHDREVEELPAGADAERAAASGHRPHDGVAVRPAGRTLEIHVLQEMGRAGRAVVLEARSGAGRQGNRHGLGIGPLSGHQRQAVGELGLRRGGLRAGRRRS